MKKRGMHGVSSITFLRNESSTKTATKKTRRSMGWDGARDKLGNGACTHRTRAPHMPCIYTHTGTHTRIHTQHSQQTHPAPQSNNKKEQGARVGKASRT